MGIIGWHTKVEIKTFIETYPHDKALLAFRTPCVDGFLPRKKLKKHNTESIDINFLIDLPKHEVLRGQIPAKQRQFLETLKTNILYVCYEQHGYGTKLQTQKFQQHHHILCVMLMMMPTSQIRNQTAAVYQNKNCEWAKLMNQLRCKFEVW